MDRSGEQLRGGGPTSSEQIMEIGACLLRGFICDRIGPAAKDIAELAPERVSQEPHIKKLVEALKRKAQEIDNDKELWRMIEMATASTASIFFHVAEQLFSDGISWGRIAVLFCFSSTLVLKAVYRDTRALISTIMGWTMDFLRKRLLPWIQEQGGWDGLLSQLSITVKWLGLTVAIIAWAVGIIMIGVLALKGNS